MSVSPGESRVPASRSAPPSALSGVAGECVDGMGIFRRSLVGSGHVFGMHYKNSTSSASLAVVTLPDQHGFCYNSFFLLTEMQPATSGSLYRDASQGKHTLGLLLASDGCHFGVWALAALTAVAVMISMDCSAFQILVKTDRPRSDRGRLGSLGEG